MSTDEVQDDFPHGVTKRWYTPQNLKGTDVPVKLGIDEAGRGPVMGPMVYAAAFWPVEEDETYCAMGFNDSKALDERQRDALFRRMKQTPGLGWIIHSIPASELSAKMLRKEPMSLNVISHDAAADLVSFVVSQGVTVTEVYVDTVGDPEYYQKKLTQLFSKYTPPIAVTVAKKADSLYKTVSAASIAAKVTRDRVISQWSWEEKFTEPPRTTFGSGYPSDARTSEWLKENSDRVFGFPSLIRFSWAPAKDAMEKTCVPVLWEDIEEDQDPALMGVPSIQSFLKPKPGGAAYKRIKRAKFLDSRGLKHVTDF